MAQDITKEKVIRRVAHFKAQRLDLESIRVKLDKEGFAQEEISYALDQVIIQQDIDNTREKKIVVKEKNNLGIIIFSIAIFTTFLSLFFSPEMAIVPIGLLILGIILMIKR